MPSARRCEIPAKPWVEHSEQSRFLPVNFASFELSEVNGFVFIRFFSSSKVIAKLKKSPVISSSAKRIGNPRVGSVCSEFRHVRLRAAFPVVLSSGSHTKDSCQGLI